MLQKIIQSLKGFTTPTCRVPGCTKLGTYDGAITRTLNVSDNPGLSDTPSKVCADHRTWRG